MKQRYELGNILRGTVSGDFENAEEALSKLSMEFDKHFPSDEGRVVHLTLTLNLGMYCTAGKTNKVRIYNQ